MKGLHFCTPQKQAEIRTEKEFYSLPENEQVNTALSILVTKAINGLKAKIEYELDPWSFEKKIAVKFWDLPILNYSFFWIMKKCARDYAYREKIFKILENTHQKIAGFPLPK